MVMSIVKKVFGTKNKRELKRMQKLVVEINLLEEGLSALSDEQLKEKTESFKQRLKDGETLDQLLVEAFAVVREASTRCMSMRHFDVQLIGGVTLHEGRIAEMRTGEGKTLVATLPVYLNALAGNGVHVITVNDYLAQRDADWMRPLYEFLGLSVGVVVSGQSAEEKIAAYQADISYGTNNEFGFDYLRDNMAFNAEQRVQRGLNFAVIDEVDSILIDEARTPLVISGAAADSSKLYKLINQLVPKLTMGVKQEENAEPASQDEEVDEGDYTVDEKARQVELTEQGHLLVEKMLTEVNLLKEGDSLYSPANLVLLHHVHSALQAHAMFQRDVQYLVQNDQIVIVDEHTGRTMPGRRWGNGIHQAIEAKELVTIQNENQTLASTTFQNYFRIYSKLSGMTGTADTEAVEFHQIYGLDVVVIPTHKPMVRKDLNDLIFLSLEEKYQAIIEEIEAIQTSGAPVLVGTASIESSEYLSGLLRKKKIKHQVLNAKFHKKEAEIIAQAGQPGAITLATNMAGRGTDIRLGGNWEVEVEALKEPSESKIEKIKADWKLRHQKVIEAGGLHIIGSERHESRRIDNQLRGRSGRQGDPGVTRFYLSLEDNLMRIFASDKVRALMQGLGMEKGEAIEHKWVSRSIENAQRKVEGRNFDVRKQLLEYDDVANDQRRVIYDQRNQILDAEDLSNSIKEIRREVISDFIEKHMPEGSVEENWDLAKLEQSLKNDFKVVAPVKQWLDEDSNLYNEGVSERVVAQMEQQWVDKEAAVGENLVRLAEKQLMLQVLDQHWKEHLAQMDQLRQGISLRGYAQKNPKQEYKRESFELFQGLMGEVQFELIRVLAHVEFKQQEDMDRLEEQRKQEMAQQHAEHSDASVRKEDSSSTFVREGDKVGRNEPCPCGSGKKYKQCHGKLTG